MRDCLDEVEHPAAKIGMPVDLYDALAQVADDLASGKLMHHRFPLDNSGKPDCRVIPPGRWFNMNHFRVGPRRGRAPRRARSPSCGAVCCIGGWVDAKIGADRNSDKLWDTDHFNAKLRCELEELYFPFSDTLDATPHIWNSITPQQAAIAIRGLLATGKTNWQRATARKRRP
jgi:hypothetical protein